MGEIQLLKQKGWEVTRSDDFSTFPVIEAVNQGFVYALEYGKYIKIGKTQNLTERMKSLISQAKRYSMTNTGLVAYTVAHSNYSENELLLHSEFENKRVENGELFAMNLKYFAKFVSKLSFESKEPENNEDILIKITKNFSKNLLKMRKKSGLTQTKLANLLDISLRTVRRWESGTQIPRVKDMPRLCNVLNCKEVDLLGRDKNDTNRFLLILNDDGRVGIDFKVNISSRSAIEEIISRIRSELEFGFDSQVRRGIIQEA